MQIKVQRIRENSAAVLPQVATKGSAGLDLCADIEEPVTIAPGQLVSLPTGIAVAVPQGYAGFVFARSGLAIKHGIALSNGVGVIDSDFRGEIKVGLCNLSQHEYTINPADRIAQMIVMKAEQCEIIEAESLEKTERGEGGFGSTGR